MTKSHSRLDTPTGGCNIMKVKTPTRTLATSGRESEMSAKSTLRSGGTGTKSPSGPQRATPRGTRLTTSTKPRSRRNHQSHSRPSDQSNRSKSRRRSTLAGARCEVRKKNRRVSRVSQTGKCQPSRCQVEANGQKRATGSSQERKTRGSNLNLSLNNNLNKNLLVNGSLRSCRKAVPTSSLRCQLGFNLPSQ